MPFDQPVSIIDNEDLRIPQREGWTHIRDYFQQENAVREVGVVLPVGCGKSGLIAISPYAIGARRILVIAPVVAFEINSTMIFGPTVLQIFTSAAMSSQRIKISLRRRLSLPAALILMISGIAMPP